MNPLYRPQASSPSRRAVLAGSVAAVLASRARADTPEVVRVGTLPSGTVNWAVETLVSNGFDAMHGIKVEIVPLASMEASRVSFLSGSVDTVVNDILFATRLKDEGKSILFLPFTSTEGALMVTAGSAIKTLADLKGKTIGVGGGPLDKNWLLLRAAATKETGLDLLKDSHPVFGATPLLTAKVESGELDAGLLYWNYCARLQAKGYRQLVSIEEIAAELGAKQKVALGGFLFQGHRKRDTIGAFAKAMRQALTLLEGDASAWDKIKPLMQAPDEATFEALKAAFIRGIPHLPRDEQIAATQDFYAIVAKLGGTALVGNATALPADLYVDQANYA